MTQITTQETNGEEYDVTVSDEVDFYDSVVVDTADSIIEALFEASENTIGEDEFELDRIFFAEGGGVVIVFDGGSVNKAVIGKLVRNTGFTGHSWSFNEDTMKVTLLED